MQFNLNLCFLSQLIELLPHKYKLNAMTYQEYVSIGV